ncbi:MAG: pyridoxine 5'-phosphate synthase [Thermoanaerobaculia bacterium]|jgi:pyridoxine 5-phosphate synthase
MTDLSVNVDHVATLRQARKAAYPDPVEAAEIAEQQGATGITIHLRSDRRHIHESDLASLRQTVKGKLNLEMATTEEMTTIALRYRPDQVSLVPERPEEVTTEGGLDLLSTGERVVAVAKQLEAQGIAVSVFVDPEPRQIEHLLSTAVGWVEGFEINTDSYTKAQGAAAQAELRKIVQVTTMGLEGGLRVYAGHGLTTANVGPVASIPGIEELNIGHSIISRAVIVGMEQAVREMLHAMA